MCIVGKRRTSCAWNMYVGTCVVCIYALSQEWGVAAYQLGNTSSRMITEVKQR